MVQQPATPWYGFWQLVTDEPEDIIPHNKTTIAQRPHIGFSLYTENHFIEVRSLGLRQLLKAAEPDEAETISYFNLLHVCAGRCMWKQSGTEWQAEHHLTDAHDPRMEGIKLLHRFKFDGDECACIRQMPDGGEVIETWRRLSGKGMSPLAGAWQSDDPEFGRWFYLVTAGHYGVIRNSPDRLKKAAGETYSSDETMAIFRDFGFNVSARLETSQTFDHWPFMSQIPGYETRKHQTFQIISASEDAFSAAIPPHIPAQTWERLDR